MSYILSTRNHIQLFTVIYSKTQLLFESHHNYTERFFWGISTCAVKAARFSFWLSTAEPE